MPVRPRVHQPAGSKRAAEQRRLQYERMPERRAQQSLYDSAWRRYSKRRLAEHPYCVRCHARGVLRLAVVTDHIKPAALYPELFRDPDNHQSLCKTCHDRKTRREDSGQGQRLAFYPKDLRPAVCDLTLVCGPPASGKSSYIRRHMQPSDVVIDLDDILARLSGLPLYHGREQYLRAALAARNDLLRGLAHPTDRAAWFAVLAPVKRRQWWADALNPSRVIVLSVPAAECIRRIRADPRRAGVADAHEGEVRRWWREEAGAPSSELWR